MLLLLLLPILVSGYIVFSKHPYHFYRLHRYEGQLLYLGSAYNGLICTLLSFISVAVINSTFPEQIILFGNSFNINIASLIQSYIAPITDLNNNNLSVSTDKAISLSEQYTWILLVTVNSLIIAFLWCFTGILRLIIKSIDLPVYLSWRRIKLSLKRREWISPAVSNDISFNQKAKILLMSSVLKDSPLDKLFLDSYINEEYLMLTMEDRKIYVGRVISLGEPNEAEGLDQEITITPFLSGYRDKSNLKIDFTTKYSSISKDLSLTIRQDKIISATEFSEEIWKEFKDKESSNTIDIEVSTIEKLFKKYFTR